MPHEWKSMETAPRDRPILAWCDHQADPYTLPDGRLTTYAAHADSMSRVDDGYAIVVWGGAYEEYDYESFGNPIYIPDWWFVAGSYWETAANPIAWTELPEPYPQELVDAARAAAAASFPNTIGA